MGLKTIENVREYYFTEAQIEEILMSHDGAFSAIDYLVDVAQTCKHKLILEDALFTVAVVLTTLHGETERIESIRKVDSRQRAHEIIRRRYFELAERLGITASDIAKEAGTKKSAVMNWQMGDMPQHSEAKRIERIVKRMIFNKQLELI